MFHVERSIGRNVQRPAHCLALSPRLGRPPASIDLLGPRRARFDEDEFAAPAVEDDPPPVATIKPFDDHQTARTGTRRIFVVANQKRRRRQDHDERERGGCPRLGGLACSLSILIRRGNASTALGIDHPPGTPEHTRC